MSWGIYWMFYICPSCGKKFKSGIDMITEPDFGKCPLCGADGALVGESGANCPHNSEDYEDSHE